LLQQNSKALLMGIPALAALSGGVRGAMGAGTRRYAERNVPSAKTSAPAVSKQLLKKLLLGGSAAGVGVGGVLAARGPLGDIMAGGEVLRDARGIAEAAGNRHWMPGLPSSSLPVPDDLRDLRDQRAGMQEWQDNMDRRRDAIDTYNRQEDKPWPYDEWDRPVDAGVPRGPAEDLSAPERAQRKADSLEGAGIQPNRDPGRGGFLRGQHTVGRRRPPESYRRQKDVSAEPELTSFAHNFLLPDGSPGVEVRDARDPSAKEGLRPAFPGNTLSRDKANLLLPSWVR